MKRMSLAEVTPRDTATTSEQLEIGDVYLRIRRSQCTACRLTKGKRLPGSAITTATTTTPSVYPTKNYSLENLKASRLFLREPYPLMTSTMLVNSDSLRTLTSASSSYHFFI